MMRSSWVIVILLLVGIAATPLASAQQPRLIVRDTLGLTHLTILCPILGCNVVRGLSDPQGQVFLVVSTGLVSLDRLLQLLQIQLGIVDIELDQLVGLVSPALSFIPDGLSDTQLISYYGAPVWHGYIVQPANLIVRTSETQSHFHVSGAGVVAMIDTGLDPQHPALASVALPGYDFTRNSAGVDEKADLDHSTAAVLDGGPSGLPIYVNPWLAAAVSGPAAAALSNPKYAAFGHGTMTAGIVHMVAPGSKILPLKAFSSDGTGYASDILRAIYYATAQGSKVISMSFSLSSSSTEMSDAVNYASSQGVICVASAGNDGKKIMVYPASLNNVMGVASTSDNDTQSTFSNYGSQVVWVAAPGENIVSTYPYGTYASSSGTSFSAPFVSGTAALLANVNAKVNQSGAANAISHAKYISPDLNYGRLDTYLAVGAVQH
jgi:subtilisin family serine protease